MRLLGVLLLLASSAFAGGNRHGVGFDQSYDVLPHIVFGGTWVTSLTFVNMGHEPVELPVKFFGQDGEPVEVPIVGAGNLSEVTVGIAAHGAITLITQNLPDEADVVGWAKLDVSCCADVSALAIFRQRAGGLDSEAVVPLASSLNTRSGVIFDNTDNFVTGIAMVNPSETSVATVTANFRTPEGERIILDQFTLDPREHRSFAVPAQYPATKDRDGTVEFLAHGGAITVLGLRFSPRGSFTSLHSFDPPPVQ